MCSRYGESKEEACKKQTGIIRGPRVKKRHKSKDVDTGYMSHARVSTG